MPNLKNRLLKLHQDYINWANTSAVQQSCPISVPNWGNWNCCEAHREAGRKLSELKDIATEIAVDTQINPTPGGLINSTLILAGKIAKVKYPKTGHSTDNLFQEEGLLSQ